MSKFLDCCSTQPAIEPSTLHVDRLGNGMRVMDSDNNC